MSRAGASLAAALLLGACGVAASDNATTSAESPPPWELDLPRLTVDEELRRMGPDGWHRIALYANWDFTEDKVWRWIVSQPDCDRATALAIFWKASPEYYLQYADGAAVRDAERPTWELIALIRQRWLAGGYTRSELAFDPDKDAWPLDMADLRKRHGDARVDSRLPASMRVRLGGRTIAEGPPLPGVYHD